MPRAGLHAPPGQALRGEAPGKLPPSFCAPCPIPPSQSPLGGRNPLSEAITPLSIRGKSERTDNARKKGKNLQQTTEHSSSPDMLQPERLGILFPTPSLGEKNEIEFKKLFMGNRFCAQSWLSSGSSAPRKPRAGVGGGIETSAPHPLWGQPGQTGHTGPLEFPGAVVTRDHKAGGLKPQKCVLLHRGGPKSKIQVSSGSVPSRGSRENLIQASSQLWWWPAALGVPRPVDVSVQSLPLSSHTLCVCVCVCVCMCVCVSFLSFVKTLVVEFISFLKLIFIGV